jgi:hypothetical protein
MYQRILLLSNGVADLRDYYPEGFGAYSALLKVDPDCQNEWYGSWKAEGNTVRITRKAEQPAEIYERVNGNLRSGKDEWRPMLRVDGLRLSGRYMRKSEFGDMWIELTNDGTFKTGGLLTFLAATDLKRSKPPENASGSYEIRDWTIWFKVEGRVIWSTDFMMVGEDPKDLKSVLLETYGFERQ